MRHQYDDWREQLIKCMALTEAVIDFGEDENIEDGVLNDGWWLLFDMMDFTNLLLGAGV